MRSALLYLLLASFAGFAGPACADPDADEPDLRPAKLDELFRLYAEAGRFRGAALVALGDEVLLREGYGLASERWGIPVTADTRFAAASLTKVFTATAALVLVERNKLELDRPVGAYIDGLRDEAARQVTLRQLLTHTSGLKREVFEDWVDLLQLHRSDELLVAINRHALEFEPGSQHAYSNVGLVLVRILIERMTGKPFAQALAELVLEPAGMLNTGVLDPATVIPRLATGYDIILGQAVPAERSHPSNGLGAGGLYTTVGDLLEFDRALATGRVLSPQMQQEQVNSRRFEWGLGWQLFSAGSGDDGEPMFVRFHNGDSSGTASHYLRFPQEQLVIALLSNQSDLPRTELFNKITGIINGGEPSGPESRLADELYRIVIEQGEQAGAEAAREARTTGKRGVPVAMQIVQVGNTLSRMGEDEATRRVYAFGALVDPQSPWGHLGLGQWYEEHDRMDDAVRSYCTVLEFDPIQPHALEYLAELGRNCGTKR